MSECQSCFRKFIDLKLFRWEGRMYCDSCYRADTRSAGLYADAWQKNKVIGVMNRFAWEKYLHDYHAAIIIPVQVL